MIEKLIKTSELKDGIKSCLDNGKRLLDDALFLQQKGRYSSAIPLFILSYEEINKAVFLMYKFEKNEDVTDAEYKKIFMGYSHLEKNKMFFEITEKRLQEITDREFQIVKMVTESESSITWHNTRTDAIQQAKGALSLVSKFDKIKKEFLYVDFVNGKWQSQKNKFRVKTLDSLCTVLYYTALEAYLKTSFYLDLEKMGLFRKTISVNSEETEKVFRNKNSLELERIGSFFKTSKWVNARNLVTQMIQSL
jgi:AbiV family abortive infection protein